MNVVNAGSRYQIYGEDVKTYGRLPIMSFEVMFNKMTGFYLVSHSDLAVNEEKIYGNHQEKVAKTLQSFKLSDRNFGIILSGRKGIGKSLFARILATEGLKQGYPVLLVNSYNPGIADFISNIKQEVIVIFDEFEKNFLAEGNEDSPFTPSAQDEMLPLFDGIDDGKKLFVITCNEVRRLNQYLLDRPGRFHYHFKITYPAEAEIIEYLTDKLKLEYQDNIQSIVNFSRTTDVSFDYLRAIAFDLNQGYSVDETLSDLNISQDRVILFNITLKTHNGETYNAYSISFDLNKNSNSKQWFNATNLKTGNTERFGFVMNQLIFKDGAFSIDPKYAECYINEDDFWMCDTDERVKTAADAKKIAMTVQSVSIERSTYVPESYLY